MVYGKLVSAANSLVAHTAFAAAHREGSLSAPAQPPPISANRWAAATPPLLVHAKSMPHGTTSVYTLLAYDDMNTLLVR
jgi:hypothetical protein